MTRIYRWLVLSAVILSFGPSALADSSSNPLYEELSHAKEVKIFVALPTDPAGQTKLDLESFRKRIEEALKTRKSIHFSVVASEAEARFVVETKLKGFLFSLHDPVDMLMGAAQAAADAMKDDHFAALDADMAVRDSSGKTRWSDALHASVTDEKMTETESRGMILDRAAAVFVREAFGKKNR